MLANGFLCATAVAGGAALVLGWRTPPVELLAGSAFASYRVPGLALGLVVGGSALLAAELARRRHALAATASLASAGAICVFEAVEVTVIGWHWLQVAYFLLGASIAIIALRAIETRQGVTR